MGKCCYCFIAVVVVIIAFFSLGAYFVSQGKTFTQHFKEGKDLYLKGKYEEALQTFGNAYEFTHTNENQTNLYYYTGLTNFALQQYEEAVNNLNEANTHSSKYLGTANIDTPLAESYYALKRYGKAEQHYKKAISRNPNDAYLHYQLGSAYNHLTRYNDAIIYVTKAIELNTTHYSNSSSYKLLAEANVELGRNEMAIEHYIKALSFEPNDADLHYRLGSVYHSIKRYNDAIIHLNRAVELSSDLSSNVYILLAESNVAIQQYDIAIDRYKTAMSIRPNDADLHYRLGSLYHSIKRYNDAITHFKRLIELEPSDNSFYYLLGDAYLENRQYEEAVDQYKHASLSDEIISPKLDNALLLLGEEYANGGLNIDASHQFEFAISHQTSNPDHYVRLGNINKIMMEYDKGMEILNEGIKRFPSHFLFYKYLGDLYYVQTYFDQAIFNYKRAIKSAQQQNQSTLSFSCDISLALIGNTKYQQALDNILKAVQEIDQNNRIGTKYRNFTETSEACRKHFFLL